jgi:hypothetical protein
MKCFKPGFILARSVCGNDVPRSGLYIDDLPGITLTRAANIADGHLSTGKELFEYAEREAYQNTMNDFKQRLMQDLVVNSVIDNLVYENRESKGTYKAFPEVRLTIENYSCVDYAQIKIKTLSLRADAPQSGLTLTFVSGGETFTMQFDIVEGYNQLHINEVFPSNRVDITFNPNFEIWTPVIGGLRTSGSCTCVGSDSHLFADFRSATGIGMIAQLVCDTDVLSCMFEDNLKYAIRYRMGVIIAELALSSDRVNPYLRAAKNDSMENLLVKWWGGADPKTGWEVAGEYWRQLDVATKTIIESLKRSDSLCFRCDRFFYTQNRL